MPEPVPLLLPPLGPELPAGTPTRRMLPSSANSSASSAARGVLRADGSWEEGRVGARGCGCCAEAAVGGGCPVPAPLLAADCWLSAVLPPAFRSLLNGLTSPLLPPSLLLLLFFSKDGEGMSSESLPLLSSESSRAADETAPLLAAASRSSADLFAFLDSNSRLLDIWNAI